MLGSVFRTWSMVAVVFLVLSAPVLAQQQEPDTSRGPSLFQNCVRCHTIRKGGKHRFGPNLFGLMQRNIASAPGYNYSTTLKGQTGPWDEKLLNAFIAKPHLAIPGNKMSYEGLMNPHDRADLLGWLMIASTDPDLSEEIDQPLGTTGGGNPTHGRALSRPCRMCHNFKPDEGHKIGPNLFGILGRKVAGAEGFNYSDQHLRRGGYWTPDALANFFQERKGFRQGTHRAFKTLKGPIDRADLIAYLATLKSDKEQQSPPDAESTGRGF